MVSEYLERLVDSGDLDTYEIALDGLSNSQLDAEISRLQLGQKLKGDISASKAVSEIDRHLQQVRQSMNTSPQ